MVCMANTKPVVDRTEILQYVLEEGRKTPIHVLACAAVSKNFGGKELTDMEALKAAGAVGFTDDGIPLRDGAFVQRAMQKAKELLDKSNKKIVDICKMCGYQNQSYFNKLFKNYYGITPKQYREH